MFFLAFKLLVKSLDNNPQNVVLVATIALITGALIPVCTIWIRNHYELRKAKFAKEEAIYKCDTELKITESNNNRMMEVAKLKYGSDQNDVERPKLRIHKK